jgi:hypothetical protein
METAVASVAGGVFWPKKCHPLRSLPLNLNNAEGLAILSDAFSGEYVFSASTTAKRHLPNVPVIEHGIAHSQFSTFERTRGDTNGHQIGHQIGHHLQ